MAVRSDVKRQYSSMLLPLLRHYLQVFGEICGILYVFGRLITANTPLDRSASLVLSVINWRYCSCTDIRHLANPAINLAGAELGRISKKWLDSGFARDGDKGGTCPPKIREKYFWGNYYEKFGHFSGKNHVKFRNFVNFSGKYHKNWGILIIFSGKSHVKFAYFVIFFIHIFRAKMSCPPKVDWDPAPVCQSQSQNLVHHRPTTVKEREVGLRTSVKRLLE